MFPGLGCGPMSVGGWVVVGLFWVTFVGVVLWVLSRLFHPSRGGGGLHEETDDVDLRLAQEQMDLLRTEPWAATSPSQGVIGAGAQELTQQPAQARTRSKAPD